MQEERLRRYVLRHPFKTGQAAEDGGPWLEHCRDQNHPGHLQQEARTAGPMRGKKASFERQDGDKAACLLQKVQILDGEGLGDCDVLGQSTFTIINPRAQKVQSPSFSSR